MGPPWARRCVREGRTCPFPGSCTSPRDIWEKSCLVPDLQSPVSVTAPSRGIRTRPSCYRIRSRLRAWVSGNGSPSILISIYVILTNDHHSHLVDISYHTQLHNFSSRPADSTAGCHVFFNFFHQSYNFQCASFSPPWLNLFLGILFLMQL